MPNQVISILSQSNSESIVNFAVIRASTDAGTPTAQTFNVGFNPRWIRVINLTGLITDEWVEGMAPLSSLHTVGAGTNTLELVNGVTLNQVPGSWGSFTLDATTMAASSVFTILAMG